MDAYDFAAPLRPESGKKHFSFSISGQKTIYLLKQLAEKIEAKEIAIHLCNVSSKAKHDEFTQTTLTLTFVEARDSSDIDKLIQVEEVLDGAERPGLKRLYGHDQPNFPITTVKVK